MSEDKTQTKKKKDGWREIVGISLIAIALSLIIRAFLIEMFWIPSGSMVPTLLEGDLIVVSKTSYGYSRFSLPYGANLPVGGRLFGEYPERGDVLVFHGTKKNIDYVKRLIGFPGDTIQVRQGILFVNGESVRRILLKDYLKEGEEVLAQYERLYSEKLPGGREHFILEGMGDNGYADNTPLYRVPENHFFVMGDNRDNSVDSRYLNDVGFVPYDNLVGRVEMVLISFGEGHWWQFWRWPFMVRYNRSGLSVL